MSNLGELFSGWAGWEKDIATGKKRAEIEDQKLEEKLYRTLQGVELEATPTLENATPPETSTADVASHSTNMSNHHCIFKKMEEEQSEDFEIVPLPMKSVQI